MSIKITWCVLASLAFVGSCGGASAQALHPQVSNAETQKFLKQFEQVDANQRQAWKTFTDGQTGRINQIPGALETWVQAANKKEACKVYAATFVEPGKSPWWDKAGNYVNWDGSCVGGYASGIGREFTLEEGELSAWLADYQGVKKPPKYYLVANYNRQTIEFKAASHPLYVSLQYVLNEGKTGKQLAVNYAVMNMAEDRLYRRDGVVGVDQVSKSLMLPNKNSYAVVQSTNPMAAFSYHTSVNDKWERMGYSIVNHNNGIERKIMQTFNPTPVQNVEVNLPASYIAHLKKMDSKINSNLNGGERALQQAFAAIRQYQTRVCQGMVKVDFMDSGLYGRVCLENGELNIFNELIAAALEQQKQAHDQARIELTRKKEAMSNLQAAQMASKNESTKKIGTSLQQFVDEVEKSSQRASDFARSTMNAKPSWNGQHSSGARSKVNCVLAANVVQCGTRQ
jgi:hypothetical protein